MSASLFGAATASAVAVLDPFDHDVWLVAYLFLVGFLAQSLLGRTQAVLLARDRASALRPAMQPVLWSAGVIAVPLGVLAEARLAVVIGGVFLLAALAAFWRNGRAMQSAARSGRNLRLLRAGHMTLVAFMAASVVIGTALAWHTPWV